MFGNHILRPTPSRREWLRQASNGFGMLAFSSLLAKSVHGATHHEAKAKNVILCFMDGGPSHVDTFDPKPLLKKRQGEKIGLGAISSKSQSTPDRVWLGSPSEFHQYRETRPWVSALFPDITLPPDHTLFLPSH